MRDKMHIFLLALYIFYTVASAGPFHPRRVSVGECHITNQLISHLPPCVKYKVLFSLPASRFDAPEVTGGDRCSHFIMQNINRTVLGLLIPSAVDSMEGAKIINNDIFIQSKDLAADVSFSKNQNGGTFNVYCLFFCNNSIDPFLFPINLRSISV